MLSRKFNPSASSARLSQSTSYEMGWPQISSISLTRSGSVVSCSSLILRRSFNPIGSLLGSEFKLQLAILVRSLRLNSKHSPLFNPHLFDPGSQVRPGFIGRAIVRPEFDRAIRSQAIVIAVVLTERQKFRRQLHLLPTSLGHFTQTQMARVRRDDCGFDGAAEHVGWCMQ